MDEISLDLKGFHEMIDTLEKMDKQGESIFKKALNEGIKPVLEAIKRRAPVYKGPAKSSIKTKKSILPGFLRDSVNIGKVRKGKSGSYSQIVGIRPAFYGIFSEYGTSHEPARPWMRPAFDESKEEAFQKIEQVMSDGIENAFKG